MNILDAYKLASRLHAGQFDKAGRPYIEHLSRVFLRVSDKGGDSDQKIAALLHDSIEDEKTTEEQLLQHGVPASAVALVVTLTKDPEQPYLDYVAGIKMDGKATLVKLCDLEDNSDPERLAALELDSADRLRKKYGQALKLLQQ